MKNKSLPFLIISNLVPVAGVLAMGWSTVSVVLFYWIENIVIGFYNILKMIKAEKPVLATDKVTINSKPFIGKPSIFVVLFFVVHFGIFTFVHGVFIYLFFVKSFLDFVAIFYGFFFLMISHGASYINNYLAEGEYKKVSRIEVMFMPYKRIVVLQFVIIFGGMAIQFLSLDIGALIILIVLKTVIDVKTHQKEHVNINNH